MHPSSYLQDELRNWVKQISGDYTGLLNHCIVSDLVRENIVEISDSTPNKVRPIIELSSENPGCSSVGDDFISL
jgi:hypothetical protein